MGKPNQQFNTILHSVGLYIENALLRNNIYDTEFVFSFSMFMKDSCPIVCDIIPTVLRMRPACISLVSVKRSLLVLVFPGDQYNNPYVHLHSNMWLTETFRTEIFTLEFSD